ncbi:Pre-mRNA-splicing factor SYF1 [Cryptosporidium felis]|nr:Pre-mRNA-splicing factor SYF1 [Cryptosporidium felis]
MNGVEENLRFLQTLRYDLLKDDLFRELKGFKVYEDQLGKRKGQVVVWTEYISKIQKEIEIKKEGLQHEIAYITEYNELNQDLESWMKMEVLAEFGVCKGDVQLLYMHDYCLLISRRALSSTNRRVPSIWSKYLNFVEDYEKFMENRISKRFLGLDLAQEYESALKSCNDADIWLNYSRYLRKSRIELTKSRHVLDKSLRSLPLELHHRVWEMYLEYITEMDIPELSISVLKRFLLFSYVRGIGMYIKALLEGEKFLECLEMLINVILEKEGKLRTQETIDGLNKGISYKNKSFVINNIDDLYELVLFIISENVLIIGLEDVKKFTNSLLNEKLKTSDDRIYQDIFQENKVDNYYRLTFGELLIKVAQIFMKLAEWEYVYDIFDFGVENCKHIHDFTVIYDSLMMFSSVSLDRLLVSGQPSESNSLCNDNDRIKHAITRLENIIKNHKKLLYRALLRNDSNNISRWIEYINIIIKNQKKKPSLEVVKIFEEAVQTIDFSKVKDKSKCVFWIYYALYMTSSIDNGHEIIIQGDNETNKKDQLIDLSRDIFERALREREIEDYSMIWTEWIEMELRFGNYDYALDLSRRSICMVKDQKNAKTLRNGQIWQLAADLEMSLGTLESSRAFFQGLFENGMLNSRLARSFGNYLREHGCFEESFSFYERSLNSLTLPYSFIVWLDYIDSFISHYNNGLNIIKLFEDEKDNADIPGGNYGNAKIDRLRDVFEQNLDSLLEWKKNIKRSDKDYYYDCLFISYSIYSAYEAKIGRVKRAFEIFERSIEQLEEDHGNENKDLYKVIIYSRWIDLTLKCMDISYTRKIFERAMDDIKASDILIRFSLRFANFELNLGEVNRVRSIFMFAGDLIPNIYLEKEHINTFNRFWSAWNQFELEYGNEDTIKDMVRVKKNIPLISGHSSFHSSEIGKIHKSKRSRGEQDMSNSNATEDRAETGSGSDSDSDEILLSSSSDSDEGQEEDESEEEEDESEEEEDESEKEEDESGEEEDKSEEEEDYGGEKYGPSEKGERKEEYENGEKVESNNEKDEPDKDENEKQKDEDKEKQKE